MSEWQKFSPTYTYRRKWWERLMFWRPKPKYPVAVYKQVGRVVSVRFSKI